MKSPSYALAVTLALSSTGLAFAHGDQKPGAKTRQAISKDVHAWGREGDPGKAARTINVDMNDTMRFTPGELTVKQGQTVKFVVSNSGKQLHEMVIGTEEELKKHAELMKKHPGMKHDEPYMAHVQPGKKETIAWTFTNPGTFMYGCLVPGHWEAGMKGKIIVASAHDTTAKPTPTSTPAPSAASAMADGEVRKVDMDAKKITLKHGQIVNLDMPPMTMVFAVKDPAMLQQVKQGDKVRFSADKINGVFTVTQIEAAK